MNYDKKYANFTIAKFIFIFTTATSSETKLRVNKPELTTFKARWKAAYPARVTSYHMTVTEEGKEEEVSVTS